MATLRWTPRLFIVLLLIATTVTRVESQRSFLEDFIEPFRKFRLFTLSVIGRSTREDGLRKLEQIQKLQPLQVSDFPCISNNSNSLPLRSSERPTSVHRVRPGDIDIIAALGDSLTAGNGAAATHLLQVTVENRGIAWAIGGQGNWKQFLTLPNILKEFNPKLFGYSTADSFSTEKESQFNVAETGAMSRDLIYMTKQLIKRIQNDKRVDLQNDWKLISLMIGSNDFCADMCYSKFPESFPERRRKHLIQSFTLLRDNLPRTIVNFVLSPNLKILYTLVNKPPLCELTHLFECPCLFGTQFSSKRKLMLDIMTRWQQVDEEVANMPEFQTDDFTIVLQTFTKDITFPSIPNKKDTDFTYMSTDCFHFSQKGNARASNALWNNLLEPVGKKSTNWDDAFKHFNCPTKEHPYIFTNKNSLEA